MFKVTFDDSGLRRLERNLKALEQSQEVSFAELFTPAFIRRTTSFLTFEALLDASGFRVESAEDFAAIPDAEWDTFIAGNTSFANWAEMRETAAAEWMKRQLMK
jgi:hypothetical protein